MFPDANTIKEILNALKLPGQIIAGLFLFSVLALVFDYFGLIALVDFGSIARPIVIIATLLFLCLSVTTAAGIIYKALMQGRQLGILAARREMRRAEADSGRAKFEADVLKRVDYLSSEELRIVTNCLRKNQQSFKDWIHDPDVGNLIAKQFVSTLGTTHNQDHYPFYFVDFVWHGLLDGRTN